MFEKEELEKIVKEQAFEYMDILGDMVISIEQVEQLAKNINTASVQCNK